MLAETELSSMNLWLCIGGLENLFSESVMIDWIDQLHVFCWELVKPNEGYWDDVEQKFCLVVLMIGHVGWWFKNVAHGWIWV